MFHGTATQRKRKNFIKGLKDDEGVWHEEEDKVSSLLIEYYSKLFSTSHPHDFDHILDGVDLVITEELRVELALLMRWMLLLRRWHL